ncbi:hypothetical protein [Halorussus ruber]|uniref:hypothetical protein n=1 Tax=Halorussus ruber TaxID=1126238 RepID=UPI0010933025|nr:hypothetical protein [Halorussus ruber]
MSRNVLEAPELDETELDEPDETGEVALPNYGPWVSLYGFLHRYARPHTGVFAGTATVGLLVLVRQFYAFVFGPAEWSGLPPWSVLVGVLLFGFGVNYYAVRDDTACSECGTAFSRERVEKRPVRNDSASDADSGVYIRETLECQSCDHRTTEIYRQPEKNPPRF